MIEITDANFEAEVLQSPTPVIVDFWADWCGPCKMIAPIFEELSGKYGARMKFGKYDVDVSQDRAQEFGIRGIPALVLFRDGKEIDRVAGFVPKAELEKRIRAALGET